MDIQSQIATMEGVNCRILDPDEHEKLKGMGPFNGTFPDPATSAVVVLEKDGKIVGFWCAFNAVHLEPLWVEPDYRDPGSLRKLWGGLLGLLKREGVTAAFSMIDHGNAEKLLPLAVKLGFKILPVTTFGIEFKNGAD